MDNVYHSNLTNAFVGAELVAVIYHSDQLSLKGKGMLKGETFSHVLFKKLWTLITNTFT
jgi:hypothetical protein